MYIEKEDLVRFLDKDTIIKEIGYNGLTGDDYINDVSNLAGKVFSVLEYCNDNDVRLHGLHDNGFCWRITASYLERIEDPSKAMNENIQFCYGNMIYS